MGRNKRDPRSYTHTQVPFVTRNGVETTCDEALFDILTLLKKMGVETHFSCQGDDFGGYICAFTPGMRPVINKTISLHGLGWLSDQSMAFLDDWCREGYREVRWPAQDRRRYGHVNMPQQYFSYERDQESIYGDRTTVRWPKHRKHELKQLLIEIQPHI